MKTQLSVGKTSIPWAEQAVSEAFFATISYRLEPQGRGAKFPVLLGDWRESELSPLHLAKAKEELVQIEKELRQMPVDKVIADLANLSTFQGQRFSLNSNAPDVYHYFVNAQGKPLVQILSEALTLAQIEQKPLVIKEGGFSPSHKNTWVAIGLMVLGLGLIAWSWHTATTEGYFYDQSTVAGPILLLFGLGGIVSPDLMQKSYSGATLNRKRLTIQMILLGVGMVIGFLYLHLLSKGM